MSYLVKQLQKVFPDDISLIKVPDKWNSWNTQLKKIWHLILVIFLKNFMREDDSILLMEYLGNRSGDQAELALRLRKYGLKNKTIGLVHLSPLNLKELYVNDGYIIHSLNAIDRIIVFGTSLELFFSKLGFRDKLTKTFHYVDTEFYYVDKERQNDERLKVISMGSLKRNRELLKEIISECSFADFIICMGSDDYSFMFKEFNYVTTYGYLNENELLVKMQGSDVSLSVLNDTVGSNVIVTSLATGLVNVVSDVGSIRDYCNDKDSFLCSGKTDFINALNRLNKERGLLSTLSQKSIKKAQQFSLKRFLEIFPALLE